jgi:hypothetical protein
MVQPLFDPGTISVPMSSILDALEGVLTEAERTALFEKLIGLRPGGVAPGDLITAELFNQVLSDINDLAQRVALLEAAASTMPKQPVIKQIIPQIVRTGDDFQVIGENLNPNLLSRIEVEDTPIPLNRIQAGSGPTLLILEAPAVIGLPANGGSVILTVGNPAGNAQGSYIQLPGVNANLQATVAFLPKTINPTAAVLASTTYQITYEITIHSSHNADFQLKPKIKSGWTAVVQGSDKITATEASALAGLTVSKVIVVTTGASGSADLVLQLAGTTFGSFSQSSSPLPIVIGQQVAMPSNQIQITDTKVLGPHAYSDTTNTVQVWNQGPTQGGATVALNVQVMLKKQGIYPIVELVAEPAADWGVTGPSSTVAAHDDHGKLLSFTITPKKKDGNNRFSSAPGTISFKVKSPDGTATTPFSAKLQVVAA